MMAYLTKEILPKVQQHAEGQTPAILYSFCDEAVNNSASSALATAIHQLLQESDVRLVAFQCDNLRSLGEAKADIYPVSSLWELLCQTIRRAKKAAFLVLDDIDTCDIASRMELLSLLNPQRRVKEKPNIKVLISSRGPPAIPDTTRLRIDEMDPFHTQDMDQYCVDRIHAATEGRSFDHESKADIFTHLRKTKTATFLSLTLLLKKLSVTPRTALSDYKLLPVDADNFYRHVMDNLPAESRPLCLRMLRIIFFTFRPLTAVEFYHATKSFQQSPGESKSFSQNMSNDQFIKARRCIAPFLCTESTVVELIHSTAKTSLLSFFQFCSSERENAIFNVQRAHEDISIGCLHVLMSFSTLQWPAFWQDAKKAQLLFKQCMQSDPLLEYAFANWYKHLTQATMQLQRHQDMNPQLLAAAIEFAKLWEDPTCTDFRAILVRESHIAHYITPDCCSPLAMFTALRIKVIIYYILDKSLERSRTLALRGSSESAIHQAIATGQVEILGAVMEYFDITSLEGDAYSGLLRKAAASGRPEVVRHVLRFRRRDPGELAQALHQAMAARSLGAIEALAEESGTFSEGDRLWQTNTLHRLFWNRNPGNGDAAAAETLRLGISFLVQHEDVDVQSQDGIGNTALHYACWMNWDSSVLSFLMDLGANPYAINKFGWTALHLAAKYCHRHSNVKTLLARGGQALARHASRGGMTPLHWAAQRHDLKNDFSPDEGGDIVRTLLKTGADPLLTDGRGRTPIDIAGSAGVYLFQSAYTSFDGVNTITLWSEGNEDNHVRANVVRQAIRSAPGAITEISEERSENDSSNEIESDPESPTFFSAETSRQSTLENN